MTSDLDAYAAPPAERPTSAGAIVALVLAIVLLLPAFMGVWWVELIPVLIAALSWSGISNGTRRGSGLAIAASIVAVLGGMGTFLLHRQMAKMFEQLLTPFADALAADDRATLEKWTVEGADASALADKWKRRVDAAKQELGAYRGQLGFGDTWFGSFKDLVVPPSGLEEFEPKGESTLGPAGALWIRATFEKGQAWLALEGKRDAKHPTGGTSVLEMFKHVDPDGHLADPHSIADVRLFRTKAAGVNAEK